ncbi:hypothetical protein [Streptomyces sp. NPDC059786]|uniref:hypothetical protein n=1 Tax=Streptomyces sp. NPDC059786 TaxID=3346946 RepID=UPI003665D610
MRTTPSPAGAAGRTLTRVLTAGASLLVLALALAGLPLLLAWATPVIWAATHDDLTHLLDRPDTGHVFLLLLVAAGWIGWAQFTVCTVRELIAQARGRTWHAPRGMGASQRAAALLVGSILVLLPTGSALASDAQAAAATTAARVPGQTQAPRATAAGQAQTPATSSAAAQVTYTVRQTRPAESLWGIAERELGDGERWREIADLNDGRTMTDGAVFRATSFLQPGWQLRMPGTATAAGGIRAQLADGTEEGVAEENEHVVTVRPGDYLSKIAEKELGDGDEWPALFEASQGKAQPHGLPEITDPDIIFAGQQVTVPEARPDQSGQDRDQGGEPGGRETAPPATQHPDGKQTPGDGTGGAQAPAPSRTQAPAPATSAPSSPSKRPAEQPEQGQSSSSAAASAAPEASAGASPSAASSAAAPASPGFAAPSPAAPTPAVPATAPSSGSPLNLRIVLGAGALLAASITGALALRRTLQRRRRKPGEKIAIASETSTAEAKLAAAAEPGGAARLDVALRTLAHHVAQEETAVLPPLRAARISSRALEVLPEDLAQDPVAPFTPGRGGWWALHADAVLLNDEAARDVPAPYPGLVTIGSTQAGDLLLLNLAQLPALLLDGNPVHITEVCTSLALELAMSPWTADVEVITVGFGEDLPQLLPTARIAHMRQAVHALRDVSERLLEAHQMPEAQHQPYLLLCASSLDEDTAWQFADVIDRAGAVPVTLIAPARTAAARFPEAEILNVSLSEPQTLDYVGTDITVQRLEHAAYQQITTALKVSGQQSHPAEGPWQDVPDELDTTEQSGEALAEEPLAPAAASVPSPSAATTAAGDAVFPALLAADTDPSRLRLLSPAPSSSRPDDETGPDTEAAVPAAPASSTASGAADTAEAEGDDPATAGEGPTAPAEDECETKGLHPPEIRVLGPVEVTGVASTGHGPKLSQLAALLYLRPGRSADVLCAAMDPISPWSTSTLNARLKDLRSRLGNNPDGHPYVPRRKSGDDPYRLSRDVRCDWSRFLQLAERALPLGASGVPDAERALALVRGKPFGSRPLPWAEPYQQEMITRIIDVAHTVATYRTPPGPHQDLGAARQALATGLDVDPTAELLYRDWLKIECAAGNRQGMHTAITRVQQVNRALDCSLEPETEQLINELLNGSPAAVRRAP